MKMLNGYTLFFALQYAFQTSGNIQFTSDYKGKNITRLVGASVAFTWSYSGGVEVVTWGIKNDSADDFIANGVLVSRNIQTGNPVPGITVPADYAGRVSTSFSGDSSSGQAIFTLTPIGKNDQRFYGCRINPVNDFHNIYFDSVNLIVQGPPDITEISPNQTVKEGDKVTLNCTADANPTASITWTRVSDNSIVTFPLTISKQDKGIYRCTAYNGIGNPVSRDVFIAVQYKPKGAAIIISAAQNTALQGENVTITCHVTEAKPPVSEYKFYFNDSLKTVQNVDHFTMTNVQRSQHYGKYKCVARNDVGEGQSCGVFLNINIPAKIMSVTPNVTVNETNPIDLRCDASGHPAPVIKWSKDGGCEQSTASNHYRIDSSKTSDSGAFVCIAENVAGRAEMKTFVTVYYAATIKSATPLTTKSWIGQTVSLKCAAEGLPTPTITWKKTSGIEIKKVSATENTADVKLKNDQDFGQYTCAATNDVGAAATKTVEVQQIKAPDSPSITVNIQATSISVSWTAPADGGSPVTAYRVVVLEGSAEIRNEDITDLSSKTIDIGGLTKSTNYTVMVFARNFVFEGIATERKIQTKDQGSTKPTENQTGSSCDDEKITLHAIYVTVIVFLLISNVVLISFLCRMRSRSEHSERSNRQCPRCGDLIAMNPITVKVEPDIQPSSSAPTVDGPTSEALVSANYMLLHTSTNNWEVSREQVNIIKVIGKGAFSQVAQATVRNIHRGKEITTVAAAKMLKANAPASDKKDLLSELELMKKLKPHPHVIKLMGCVTKSDPLLVLIEYVPYGDLLRYLRKSRGPNDTYFKDPDAKPQSSITAERLMKFAWQVADGMFYLSSEKIIHRDLAARNVLVGEGEKCKVANFGMARNVQQDDTYNRTSGGRLPVKWTAYEALMYGTYTTQSDVWSFGVLLYEILTVGGSPYPDINPREIAKKLQEGYRMPKPRHVEDKLYQIILRCWKENPVDRPTFDKLRKAMKEMERNHKMTLT